MRLHPYDSHYDRGTTELSSSDRASLVIHGSRLSITGGWGWRGGGDAGGGGGGVRQWWGWQDIKIMFNYSRHV